MDINQNKVRFSLGWSASWVKKTNRMEGKYMFSRRTYLRDSPKFFVSENMPFVQQWYLSNASFCIFSNDHIDFFLLYPALLVNGINLFLDFKPTLNSWLDSTFFVLKDNQNQNIFWKVLRSNIHPEEFASH